MPLARYFLFVGGVLLALLFVVGAALPTRDALYFFSKRSMRPAVSINFCLPVKNGWHEEQISTRISPLWVERVLKLCPQAQMTLISL